MLYRNKKTGHLYRVIHKAIDSTNERSGTEVYIYHMEGFDRLYVREVSEFEEKFEVVDEI